jgi:signal transduction histidine kinase
MTALRLLEPLRDRRTLLALAFVLSGLPLGIAWFVLLVTGWSVGLGLAITLLGLPILIALGAACHGAAALERTLANSLLGTGARRPAKRPVPRGILARLRDWVADPVVWRAQAYMLLRFVLGLPAAVAVLAVAGAGGALAALPFYYRTGDEEVVAVWDVDSLWEALLCAVVGLVILAVAVPWVTRGIAAAWAPLARGLLDGRPSAAAPPEPPPAPAAERRRPPGSARRGLAVHASITAGLALVLVAIWSATMLGEYFWPAWPLMALALLLAGHALVVSRRPGLPRGRRALEIHAGLAALVNLFLIGVWLMSTPGGYFWPVWTIVGLGAPVAIHAGLVLLGATEREEMADRIDVLTTTRSGAVDAQAAELRRIERDLHDGAQARLVALAMDLGMAREKLGADPGAAEALVAEAHEEAKRALVELRDLARGIHPAVLTDRGLEAALASLTGTGPVPVDLETSIPQRPPPAIEAAAYFVVAEALANAAKHSGAERVRVRVVGFDDRLLIEVADDGRGGADPAGEGLVGLRRRVEALDGRLGVGGGPDGGTIVRAELPCGS